MDLTMLIKKPNESLPYKYYPIGLRSITWHKLKSIDAIKFKFTYWADARAQPEVENYPSNFNDMFIINVFNDTNPSITRKKFINTVCFFGFCFDIITAKMLNKLYSVDISKFTSIVRQRLIVKFIDSNPEYTYDYLSDTITLNTNQ